MRLSTRATDHVTNLLEDYKRKAQQETKTIFEVLSGIKNKNCYAAYYNRTPPKHQNLMDLIVHPRVLLMAYRSIKSNKGIMTNAWIRSIGMLNNLTKEQRIVINKGLGGPDGISISLIGKVSWLLRRGKYPWGVSKRTYVPKPGVKDVMRPLTIPPFMDKVVQAAILMVLEAIYEPWFDKMNRSFGFRPGKSSHDAITAIKSYYTSGMRVALEGDLKAAYDLTNRDKLLEILGRRIEDRRFLNLIRQRLEYTYFDTKEGKYVKPDT